MHVFCHFPHISSINIFPYSCIPLKLFFFFHHAAWYYHVSTASTKLICKIYRGGLRRWSHPYILEWNICFATDVKLHDGCIILMGFLCWIVVHSATEIGEWHIENGKIHSNVHQYSFVSSFSRIKNIIWNLFVMQMI